MPKHVNQDTVKIRLCINCFNCKKKRDDVYCKLGAWKEKYTETILHTPYDFNCNKWDES